MQGRSSNLHSLLYALCVLLTGSVAFAENQLEELRNDSRLHSLYTLHCSGCHLRDGSSLPSKGIPDLKKSGVYAGTEIGRQYLMQVPGVAQAQLDDHTLAKLLNWMLVRFSFDCLPVDFVPFDAATINKWRVDPASDSPAAKAKADLVSKARGHSCASPDN